MSRGRIGHTDYNSCLVKSKGTEKASQLRQQAAPAGTCSLLIIGGGMAGLTAAIYAALSWEAATPFNIVLLDANKEPGKKLLVTGNGRCNITNLVQNADCYRSSAGDALKDSFFCDCAAWPEQLLEFLHSELGVLTHDRQGYIYPRSDQASTIQKALLRKANALGIQILSGVRATSVIVCPDTDGRRQFLVTASGLPSGTSVRADSVILATGGMVSEAYGCTGDGYRLAQSLGHPVTRRFPSLCMLLSTDPGLQRLAGVRTTGEIRLYSDGQMLASSRGELQFTAEGISGIPTFQVSRYAAEATENHEVTAVIDFLPELQDVQWDQICRQRLEKACKEISALQQAVLENRSIRGASLLQEFLLGLVPDKTAAFLIDRCGEVPERKLYKLPHPDQTLRRLLALVRHAEFAVTGIPGFEKAQVTAGGVSLSGIDAGMESAKVPGLYLSGELLDVDGICGGYNLTFAFHSGSAAGKSAARRLMKENGDNKCSN